MLTVPPETPLIRAAVVPVVVPVPLAVRVLVELRVNAAICDTSMDAPAAREITGEESIFACAPSFNVPEFTFVLPV